MGSPKKAARDGKMDELTINLIATALSLVSLGISLAVIFRR